ncbi:hypothetical protein [Natrinema hispanicum]|uniref:Uncharacterized protein n=1 Tax=Natrinema hispanicum TaxID=392421 RepID=A0A1G6QPL7_9EURY|nr:hypothetical protein [Natrinema hispanicum]SDC94213.1 hypothetical protein SAMN05192552_1009128 [Natrinema hispanicum]SET49281.1 hypothetical protein SAMN04488694_107129 [Natrinema hispanicum]
MWPIGRQPIHDRYLGRRQDRKRRDKSVTQPSTDEAAFDQADGNCVEDDASRSDAGEIAGQNDATPVANSQSPTVMAACLRPASS